MDKKNKLTVDKIDVFIDSTWVRRMCHTLAEEDCKEFDVPEKTDATAQAYYENMSAETAHDIIVAALENVEASGIKTNNGKMKKNIKILAYLQKIIRSNEGKNRLADSIPITVRLQENEYESTRDQFEILCGGKVFNSYVEDYEAEREIKTLLKGMSMAQQICVNTNAGKLIANAYRSDGTPGIGLSFIPKNHDLEIDLAVAEAESNTEDLVLKVWGQYGGALCDLWTDKYDYPRKGIEAALSE